MQTTTTCPTTVTLWRPLHVRLLEALGDKLYAWSDAWESYVAKRRLARALEGIADMNEALLRDIGAPDWMIAQASARREIDRQQLTLLRAGHPDSLF